MHYTLISNEICYCFFFVFFQCSQMNFARQTIFNYKCITHWFQMKFAIVFFIFCFNAHSWISQEKRFSIIKTIHTYVKLIFMGFFFFSAQSWILQEKQFSIIKTLHTDFNWNLLLFMGWDFSVITAEYRRRNNFQLLKHYTLILIETCYCLMFLFQCSRLNFARQTIFNYKNITHWFQLFYVCFSADSWSLQDKQIWIIKTLHTDLNWNLLFSAFFSVLTAEFRKTNNFQL